MTEDVRNSIATIVEIACEHYKGFIDKGLDSSTAVQMTASIIGEILKMSMENSQKTLNDLWGLYGGKAD